MKSNKLSAFAIFSMATISVLTSCQDEDYGFSTEEVRASVYGRNFEKTFGKLSEIPTFDLSSYNLKLMGLEGGPTNSSATRAAGDVYSVINDKWFNVPSTVEKWLNDNLIEQVENKDKGTTDFTMTMPSNDILIIPVYQGQAGMIWDLYITDGTIGNETVTGSTVNEKIWSKSSGIQVDQLRNNNWNDVINLKNGNENNCNTIGKRIRSKAIKINQEAFSGTFSLYLKITNIDEIYDKDNNKSFRQYADRTIQASTAGQMIALTELNNDVSLQTDVLNELKSFYGNEDYKFMFIGCEDANTWNSDWDMNDVVFLIVGKELPEIHDKDDEIIKKRYMIEDLGSTFDFDFNDIVVDVTQVTKFEGETPKSITQTAELKHLCGTIPFQIGFGSGDDIYWFPIMPGNNNNAKQGDDGYTPSGDSYSSMLNKENNLHQNNKNYWNPNSNNIYVRVWPKAAGIEQANSNGWSDEQKSGYLNVLNSQTFSFPEFGEYPYIIACNQNVKWMKELITIPRTWFSVSPKNTNPKPIYGDGTGDIDEPEPVETDNVVIWSGSVTANTYNGNMQQIGKNNRINSFIESFNNGYTKIVIYTNNTDANTFEICAGWNTTIKSNVSISSGEQSTTIEITSDQATTLDKEGLTLKWTSLGKNGSNLEVSKIEMTK